MRWLVGLDAQKIRDNSPLLGGEDSLVAAGTEHRLALIQGDSAQILEGALHNRLAVRGQSGPAARREVDLHPLLGRQALDHLGTAQAALLLRLGQPVDLMQLLDDPLLLTSWEPTEAGIAAQHPLLLLDGQIAVLVEPYAQVAGLRRSRPISWVRGTGGVWQPIRRASVRRTRIGSAGVRGAGISRARVAGTWVAGTGIT